MALKGNSHTRLVKEILIALGTRPECRIWLNNTGAARTTTGGFIRWGLKGSPDIIGFLNNGKFFGLEIKTGLGRLSKHQETFQRIAKSFGACVYEVRSVDEAIEALYLALEI